MDFWFAVIYVAVFVFFTGMCIGSFLNVVILRALSEESIVFPASKCPKCQTPLKWWHNIPVLSYLFLRGKCAFCHEKISIQYPIVELFTGFMFLAIVYKFGLSISTLFMLIISCLFIVLAVTDIKEKVVFDFHTYILVGVGLIYNFFNFGNLYSGHVWIFNTSFVASIAGIVLGVVIMEILARSGYLLAGQRAFGEGDSFIAAGLGAVFGWKLLLYILLYSIIVQVVCTIPFFFLKLWRQKDYRTLGALVGFIIYSVIYKYVMSTELMNNLVIFGFALLGVFMLGIYTCKRILGGMKNPDGMTYMPFGPAMVVAGFYAIFFMMNVKL